ncbi:MAG: hypothetical protein IKQ40_02720 [Lachnospiraceae bacterium]|nr:hypothetical protein [Lachnospiraceae bacterium]
MIDYYKELNIDPQLSCEEILEKLRKEKKIWQNRVNAANMELRHESERKNAMIQEAMDIFRDRSKREQYDMALEEERRQKPPSEGGDKKDIPIKIPPLKKEEIIEKIKREERWEDLQRLLADWIEKGDRDTIVLANYNLSKGLLYYFAGDYANAHSFLKKVLDYEPENYSVMLYVGISALESNDPGNAIRYFEKLYEAGFSDSNKVIQGLYLSSIALGKEPYAYELICEYIAKRPDDVEFRKRAMKTYLEEITKLFGVYDRPQSVGDLMKMIEYAEKADKIYSTTRTREKLEMLQSIKVGKGGNIIDPPEKRSFLSKVLGLIDKYLN